jgi:hypothetical protein
MKEPELLVRDAAGIYMMEMCINEVLPDYIKQQILDKVGNGVYDSATDKEDEFHFDACDAVTNCTLKHKEGWEFFIQYCEGGLYAVPIEFLESKEAEEFFNN